MVTPFLTNMHLLFYQQLTQPDLLADPA